MLEEVFHVQNNTCSSENMLERLMWGFLPNKCPCSLPINLASQKELHFHTNISNFRYMPRLLLCKTPNEHKFMSNGNHGFWPRLHTYQSCSSSLSVYTCHFSGVAHPGLFFCFVCNFDSRTCNPAFIVGKANLQIRTG